MNMQQPEPEPNLFSRVWRGNSNSHSALSPIVDPLKLESVYIGAQIDQIYLPQGFKYLLNAQTPIPSFEFFFVLVI